MNSLEFAKMLNGRAYGNEISKEEAKLAASLGIVVVYGASDDLMEFEGAITDEASVYDGGEVPITKDGVLNNECDSGDDCPYYEMAAEGAKTITAVWRAEDDGPAWTYETSLPHATFDVMEDGEVFCRGIVFYLADV